MIARTTKILDVKPHPDADNLEVLMIDGAQVVNTKGQYQKDDVVIFILYGTNIPHWFAEEFIEEGEFGVIFKEKKQKYTIKARNIRGEPSDGIIVPNRDNFPSEYKVDEYYGFSSENWYPVYNEPLQRNIRIYNPLLVEINTPKSKDEWNKVFESPDIKSISFFGPKFNTHSIFAADRIIYRQQYWICIDKDSFGDEKFYKVCDDIPHYDGGPVTLARTLHLDLFIDLIMKLQKGV